MVRIGLDGEVALQDGHFGDWIDENAVASTRAGFARSGGREMLVSGRMRLLAAPTCIVEVGLGSLVFQIVIFVASVVVVDTTAAARARFQSRFATVLQVVQQRFDCLLVGEALQAAKIMKKKV